MPSLNLQIPYTTFLQQTRSEKVVVPSKLSRAGERLPQITIPPLNSINLFAAAPAVSSTQMIAQADATAPVELPLQFNWKDRLSTLTQPFDQGECGCCWAVAVATAISDIFQISGMYSRNPNVSVSYILSCFGDSLKCGGGNPFLCLQWASTHGVGTDAIVDYSWCLNNEACRPSTSRTVAVNDPLRLNEAIPPCKDVTKPLLFFTKNTRTAILHPTDRIGSPNYEIFSRTIKTHILNVGPVIGGFQVFKNLFTGKFASPDNPSGIYLENVDYTTGTWNPTMRQFAGSHAVTIVGWGTGSVKGKLLGPTFHKNDPTLKEKMFDVPYWIVRNSWSVTWGANGYYHHARFPFNQISQFDVLVQVTYPVLDHKTNQYTRQQIPTGGILMTDPDRFVGATTSSPVVERFIYTAPLACKNTNYQFFLVSMIIITLFVFFLAVLFVSFSRNKKTISK